MARSVKGWVYNRAIRSHAARLICVSPAVKSFLVENHACNPEKCSVVMNGIDPEILPIPQGNERDSVRAEFGVQSGEFLLLTIGRFDPVKGLDILIRAVHHASQLSEHPVRLLIAAEANSTSTATHRKQLQSMVRELGLSDRVSFIGFRSDCHRLLMGADVFVLPSRSEGFPLTVLEAFAAGCPVIMTDFAKRVPGIRIGCEGFDAPVEDVEALSDAITTLASYSETQREQIGRSGRDYLKRHPTLAESKLRFVREIEQVLCDWQPSRQFNQDFGTEPAARRPKAA